MTTDVMRMRTVEITALTPDPQNVRTHDEKNLQAIMHSLSAFGQRKPIVTARANDGSLVVIAGNGTLEAAKTLGWTHLTIAEVPDDWDADKARAYAIADNRTAELADWNSVSLASALVDLDAVGWDLKTLGFEPAESPGQDDSGEESLHALPDNPISKIGDVWQIGQHRIVCGDSTDAWALDAAFSDAKVGCVLTDPPYGINLDTDYSKGGGREYRAVANDDKPFDASQHRSFFASVPEQFWWGANYYVRTLTASDLDGSWLVWDKRTPETDVVIGSSFELCWSKVKHKQDLLRYHWTNYTSHNNEGHDREHPTEKPIAMLVEILNRWAAPGCFVADPFAGSGTTLIAAARSGRIGRGIELDPRYVDIIVQRLEHVTGETAQRVGDV